MSEVIEPSPTLTIYEVTYYNTQKKVREIYGRAATPEGAAAMKQSILLRPSMREPLVNFITVTAPLVVEPVKEEKPPQRKRSYE